MIMDFLTVQAPASRRAFKWLHKAQLSDGQDEEACLGRPGEDYLAGYPMKKCRSHSSMAQSGEGVLAGPDCGYTVVTSAPENAFCVIDTDGDGESACCGKDTSAETSCSCGNAGAHPLRLRHSASSSTALSSTPSGVSSPSPPALLASGLPCAGCEAHAAGLPRAQDAYAGTAPTPEATRKQQQQHLQGSRQAPTAVAAVAAAMCAARAAAASTEEEAHAGDDEGDGADLIGAFSALTSDQWAAFQAAVSGGGAGPKAGAAPRTAAAPPASGGGITAVGAQASAPQLCRPPDQARQPEQQHSQQQQQREGLLRGSGGGVGGVERFMAQAVTETPASVKAVAASHPVYSRAPAAAGNSGNGDGGYERTSTGDSNGSIASLWAAVNSVAGGAVYDSTDDSAQAGQLFDSHHNHHHHLHNHNHNRGLSNGSPAPSAAPSVPPSPSPSGHKAQQRQMEHYNHQQQYHQHPEAVNPYTNMEACLAARRTHHAGCPLPLSPAVLSLPGSPAARTASCSAERGCSNSNLFVTARNLLLREHRGQQGGQLLQQNGAGGGGGDGGGGAMGESNSASTTFDGSVYHCEGQDDCYSHAGGVGGVGGGGSDNIRAAAAARSSAHSRFSVDLALYSPRQQLHSQQHQHVHQMQLQQQHLQQMLQPPAAAVATATAGSHSFPSGHAPGSPSRGRRAGGGLALPAQPTSYTTYGYRRARSSLAAMEQGGGGGGAAAAVIGNGDADGSSSDDDDTEEATRRITAAFKTHTGMIRCSGWGLLGPDSAPTTPAAEAARRDHWAAATTTTNGGGTGSGAATGGGGGAAIGSSSSLLHSGPISRDGGGGSGSETGGGGGGKDGDGTTEEEGEGLLTRKRSSYHLTNSHAAVELFLRLNHARQTMDFVKRQTQLFASLDKAHMGVWEALQTLNELREYEAVLMAEGREAQEVAELSLLDHAFQTAELCRLHHPHLDWLHLVGLMHGLGKLLAHRRFGSQPQWAICGETYPLGCRFSPHILGSQYFTANPDRRRRLYNTATGLYDPGCGLLNVVMSWSAPEYLYLVLSLNGSRLPQDALWVLRHSKFLTLTRPHSCYLPLCAGDDLRRLPLLRSFQSLAAYRRVELPEGFTLGPEARTAYYSALIHKYIGEGPLHW